MVAFLENYAEDYAILLLGRIPGVRDYGKAKLLPSSVSRRMVYRQYADAGRDHAFSESSFKRIWRKYVPHIYSIKPMTDLCWTCKKNSTAILRNAGCEIERQSQVLLLYLFLHVRYCHLLRNAESVSLVNLLLYYFYRRATCTTELLHVVLGVSK